MPTHPYPPLEVKVWGELACFTRPETKVERVSYEVMTPSAARGILESIFWKPEFAWQVREIRVLRPVRFTSFLRNEVTTKASARTAGWWATSRTRYGGGGYFADEARAQRHTRALLDVAYIVAAEVILQPGVDADPARYRDQFRRRVQRGQCYIAPYLGCREFAAHFGPVQGDGHGQGNENETPIDWSADLGRMLFDLEYAPDGSGRGIPYFFEARIEHGVLRVPAYLYEHAGGHTGRNTHTQAKGDESVNKQIDAPGAEHEWSGEDE